MTRRMSGAWSWLTITFSAPWSPPSSWLWSPLRSPWTPHTGPCSTTSPSGALSYFTFVSPSPTTGPSEAPMLGLWARPCRTQPSGSRPCWPQWCCCCLWSPGGFTRSMSTPRSLTRPSWSRGVRGPDTRATLASRGRSLAGGHAAVWGRVTPSPTARDSVAWSPAAASWPRTPPAPPGAGGRTGWDQGIGHCYHLHSKQF